MRAHGENRPRSIAQLTLGALAGFALLIIASNTAVSQPVSTMRSWSYHLVGCSDEGGEVQLMTDRNTIARWSMNLRGSVWSMDSQLSSIRPNRAEIHVAHQYQDRTELEYKVPVLIDDQHFIPQGMVSMDFGRALTSDLATIKELYGITVAAFRGGRPSGSTVVCNHNR